MTAITLNLLSEEQIAQEANARDPFRTAIGIGAALLSGVVLAGSVLSVFASQSRTELALLRTKWETMAPATRAGDTDWEKVKAVAESISTINRQRALCAPQMALLKDMVPESIQLIRFSLAISTEVQAAVEAPPAADAAGGAKARRARLPQNVERLTLRLEGRAVSHRPEMEVDNFMQTLRTHPGFSTEVDQVQLRSIARYAARGEGDTSSVPAASFVIECRYKERK